jgi:hypothetical protein
MAVKPAGMFASLQDQDAKTETDAGSGAAGRTGKAGSSQGGKLGEQIKSILGKITPKKIQISLTEKSNQVLKAWAAQQSVHGVINVLQTADHGALSVKPGEVLAPYNSNHKVISFLYLVALWVIVFGKTLLSFSVPVICLVIVPIIMIINIAALWKSGDKKGMHRIVIAAVVTTLIITIAVPVIMKISILADDYVFSKNVNEILTSLEESEKSAGRIHADLRGGKRSSAVIQGHITFARRLSNTVIKDSFSYLLVFTIIYILIPIFSGIGLYRLSKFISKKILGK